MILGLADGFRLRQATAADHPALSMVCLRTGDAGHDATEGEDDPSLLGLIYAIPYQVFEPDLAFVVEGTYGVCGYVFGARDTQAFNRRLASNWYPELQRRIPAPDSDASSWTGSDRMRHLIHHPHLEFPGALRPFPSHGHIDLLPEVRGRGIGRKLMGFLEERLADYGSPGLHVQLDPRNRDALLFYQRLGFDAVTDADLGPDTLYAAKRFSRELAHQSEMD